MEFGSLNKKCKYQYCNQICYLPLTCSSCSLQFCEKHKRIEDHECTSINKDSVLVVQCPICLSGVKYTSSQEVNEVISNHIVSQGCVQSGPKAHEEAKASIQRCHAHKCPTKLTALNKIQCKRCRQWHCLKHRFEEDHQCDPSIFFETRSHAQQGMIKVNS